MIRYLMWSTVALISLFGVVLGSLAILLLSLPDVQKIKGCLKTTMFEVSLCPTGDNYVRINQISPHFISALIISEDAAFYQHNGFDFSEIKESLNKNIQSGGFARGGSTITQQLVKNVFLNNEKSLVRKLKEAFLTYEVEKTLKKGEILERYMNVVEFGKGIYGIKSASRHYFQKHPSELNVLESTFLVSLLPNPVKYSQSFRQKKLTAYMRQRVLTLSRKLVSVGRITQEEYQFARQNVDSFPWMGLATLKADTEEALKSLESTDFTKDSEPLEVDEDPIPVEAIEPELEQEPAPEPES